MNTTVSNKTSGAGAGDADHFTGSDCNNLVAAINSKQDALGFTAESQANKNTANGYAGLDGSGKVAAAQLPSYVDDIVEVANFAALPSPGETGKIYVTTDTNNEYRWGGSSYIQIVASPGSTDAVPEGATNKYFTVARVLATALTGIGFGTTTAVVAADTVLQAFGKVQGQLTTIFNLLTGGTTGQVLSKSSNTNYALQWVTPTSGDLSIYALKADTGLNTSLKTSAKDTIVNSINELLGRIISNAAILPASITGLIVDFDFSDVSKVTVESGAVASIQDSIGAVSSAQASVGARPSYLSTGGANNMYFARFVGGQRLTGPLLTTNTNFTLFMLRKVNAGSATAAYSVFQNGNGTADGWGYIDNYDTAKSAMMFPGVTSLNGDLTYTFPDNWEVVSVSHSAGLNKMYNGIGARYNGIGTQNPSTPTTAHSIGITGFGSYFNGDIARIMVYNRQLSDAEVQVVTKYLTDKYILNLPKRVVFGGDSKMTSLGGSPAVPNQMISALITDNVFSNMLNTAVGGRLTADVIANLTGEVINTYNPAVRNVYCIMIGHNDYATRTNTQIYNDIKTICNTVRAAGYLVVIMTDLYSTDSASNTKKDVVNGNIRTNWATFADGLADTNAISQLQDPSNTTYFGDGIHPTPAANALMVGVTKPVVEALLNS